MQTVIPHLQRGVYCIALLLLLVACLPARVPGTEREHAPSTEVVAAPTSTVPPAPILLEEALAARAIGNDDQVARDLSTLLNSYPAASETRLARYYLAESYARRGNWISARETFHPLLEASVQDELVPRVLFWIARSYEELGEWEQAIVTYDQYRALKTPLEPYAAIRQAALYQAQGQLEAAAQAYEYGAAADIGRSERAGCFEKAIALRRQLGQDDQALQLYTHLLDLARVPDYRARILGEAVALAQALGQDDQAHAWLLELVTQFPTMAQAPYAARQLVEAGDPALAAADAAQIFFAAEWYEDALPLFDRAIAEAQATGAGSDTVLELQRLRGLTLRGLGQFPEALEALAAVGSASPESTPGRQALLDWIQTLGQSGAVQEAADRYRNYASSYPEDPRAPIALDRAAQLLDRLNQSEEALRVRFELGQRYPQSGLAPAALHTLGSAYFATGQLDAARYCWELLADNQQGYEQARGAYWAARVAQQQQRGTEAHALFERAYAAAPDSYYGAQAVDMAGLPMTTTLALDAPITTDDWQTLEVWVATWAAPDAATQAPDAVPVLPDAGFVRRAVELRAVGLGFEAIGEWNSARERWANDPVKLMQVARYAHEQGEPYAALKAAEQLAALAPASASPPPEVLRRLIFPSPYADLVIAESRDQGIDPRLLYALMRQESLFNPDATSWVGARGLAQVMPATGAGIAQRLGVTDFQPDDLYQPGVSVRFGAFYIAQQIQAMEGSIHGGLAAYNGGPGNAQRWAEGTRITDPDFFTDRIDYYETRNYVRLVYGYYNAYRRLYARP